MFGRTSHLTALASRKQLLVLESELNRAQLQTEMRNLSHQLGGLRQQVELFSAAFSSLAQLGTTLSTIGSVFAHRDEAPAAGRSWFSTLFSGLKTGVALWGKLSTRPK